MGALVAVPQTEERRGSGRALPRGLIASALDGQALALRAALEVITVPLARHARACVAHEIWNAAGFRNAHDFARERYGRSGRWLLDLARLDASFEKQPRLRAAFTGADGGRPIGIVAVLLLARLPESARLADWITHARAVTVRTLRRDVRRAAEGLVVDLAGCTGADPIAVAPDADRRVADRNAARRDAADRDAAGLGAAGRDAADRDERLWVSIAMPASVRVAFDEALDLFRAVSGCSAPISSFIEALIGESRGGVPGPDDGSPAARGMWIEVARQWVRDAYREETLRRASHDWSALDGPHATDGVAAEVLRGASMTLEGWHDLVGAAGRGDASELDATMRALLAWEREARLRLGEVLAALSLEGLWSVLQFTSARHYGEQRLGMPERTIADLLRLARAVPRWGALGDAYQEGRVSAEKALVLVRLAERTGRCSIDMQAWVRHAAGCTVKRLRDEARAWNRREVFDEVPVVCGPLSVTQWMESIRREPGTTVASVARAGLAAIERPAADVFLVLRLAAGLAEEFVAEVERWRSGFERRFAALPSIPPGTPAMQAAWACGRGGARRVPAWVGLLALLEDFVATNDTRGSRRPVPDALALARAGYRCQAPGCTARCVEAHHIRPRSRGGRDVDANLVALCPFHHHHGVHGGLAEVSRHGEVDLAWRIGSGLLESRYRNESLVVS